jgi:molybdate transport system substrate-binding protein
MGLLQQKIAAGERADVLIATIEVMTDLEKQGKVVAGSRVPLGDIGIGVAVREGAPVPDISTPEAFKQALLKAKSIVYVDPTKGTSGKHFAGVLQRLGIAEAVKSKTILREGGFAVEAVAKGEAEIGVQQTSEIIPVKGVKLIGQLPGDLQKVTTYSAAIMNGAASPKPAQAFIRYLAGKEGRAVFVAKGFMAPRD